jgi:Ca2+-binding EF-hand superfamily protein
VKKKMTLLTLGAALIAVPVLAAPGGDRNMGDANKDGVLTRAEAEAHAKAMFVKLDVNKDGKLDQADRAARHAEKRAQMFDRLDANKDGSISKAEWDQADAARQAKRAEWKAKRGERAGAPGEGGERHAMRGHHGGKRGGHGGHGGPGGWMKADANGDKAISQAEFVAGALARFDRMDANKDGKVTVEERQAMRQAMRDKRGAPPAPPAAN